MSITPRSPAMAPGERFEHGSVLGGKTRPAGSTLSGNQQPKDYALDARLTELTFGTWEGFTWREVKERCAEGAAQREADKWSFTPPGGESYAALSARVAPWLAGLSRPTIAASHGGVARAVMHLVAGVEPNAASMAEITQGRAILFEPGRMRWM